MAPVLPGQGLAMTANAIWNWVAFWGPVFRDIASLVLGGLGAYLAYLAIKMGREQGRIAARQADIAETQHRIMLEQMAARPDLACEIRRNTDDAADAEDFLLVIANRGNKIARDITYKIACPGFAWEQLDVRMTVGQPGRQLFGDTWIWALGGTIERPLFPSDFVTIVGFSVSRPDDNPVYFNWRVACDGGTFPSDPNDLGSVYLEGPKQPRRG